MHSSLPAHGASRSTVLVDGTPTKVAGGVGALRGPRGLVGWRDTTKKIGSKARRSAGRRQTLIQSTSWPICRQIRIGRGRPMTPRSDRRGQRWQQLFRAPIHWPRGQGIRQSTGAEVAKGDRVAVVEAMKMEHVLHAPRDGVIDKLGAREGDQVGEGALIALRGRGDGRQGGQAEMSLHLIKLCVGWNSIEDLASWQVERLKSAPARAGEKKPRLFHRTFQTPKRGAELLDGGSLYWVIKGLVQVRQPLLDLSRGHQGGRHALLPADPEERAGPACVRAAPRLPGLALSRRRGGAGGPQGPLGWPASPPCRRSCASSSPSLRALIR